jgi:DNA-binding Xre family transcriptional regulator
MIYLSDDYVEKYEDVLTYLLGRAIVEKYSFDYIQHSISYSSMVGEIERSNITTIAFTSKQKIYHDIFPLQDNKNIEIDIYGIYGWIGYTYIRLFLDLKTTFEMLFFIFPIEEALYSYRLYHEMDYLHTLNYVKSKIKYSYLDVVMTKRKISTKELSNLTDISFSTINALRYNKRDITKLEIGKALRIAVALNVKVESLVGSLPLEFDS